MISNLDSKVMDANSEALGVSVSTLMGNAGKVIADFIKEQFHGKRIAFICGHGNNGGDGFAAAGQLKEEEVRIFLITDRNKITSETVLRYLDDCGLEPLPFEDCTFQFEVLIDCGLGTGLSGPLRPAYHNYVDKANKFEGTIISVDVPTGLGTGTQIVPDITIAIHDIKDGMDKNTCGEIVVKTIGIPEKAYLNTGPGDFLRYPLPSVESHKGSNGRLMIIGGGPYSGAPALSGMAALRIGTDLVTVYVPESVYPIVAGTNPVLIVKKLQGDRLDPEQVTELLKATESNDAVLIGPGLGRDPATIEAVRSFVQSCEKPMVIDADALTALGSDLVLTNPETVLTPHAAEFRRLGGCKTDLDEVTTIASRKNCVILLKGRVDIISDHSRRKTNSTGCVGMTGAGTGDVLAGLTAGLLSKKMSAFDAACLGAYISGIAGERAFESKSYGMIATDIIEEIPNVLNSGLKGRTSK